MNRPLFDDESLPAWLRNAGITFAGRKRATGEQPSVSQPTAKRATSEMSWTQRAAAGKSAATPATSTQSMPIVALTGAPPPWMQQLEGNKNVSIAPWMQYTRGDREETNPPWMQSADSTVSTSAGGAISSWESIESSSTGYESTGNESRGVTGALPWMSATSESSSPTESPSTIGNAGTGYLPWRQGVSEPVDQANQPEPAQSDDSLPWMFDSNPEPPAEPPAELLAPENPWDVPEPLAEDVQEEEADPFAQILDAPQEAPPEEPKRGGMLDRAKTLSSAPTPEPVEKPSGDFDWLNAEPAAPPAAVAPDEFSFLNADQPPASGDFDWLNAEPAAPPVSSEIQPEANDFDWLNADQTPQPGEMPKIPPQPAIKPLRSLKSLSDSLPPEPPAAPEPVDASADSSWMNSFAPDASVTPESADAPDWMNSFAEDAPAAVESTDIPDWLNADAPATTNTVEDTVESNDAPDWMSGIGSSATEVPDLPLPDFGSPYDTSPGPEAETETFAAPDTSDMPDWMRDMSPASTANTASSPAASESVDQGDVPDWLRTMAPSDLNTPADVHAEHPQTVSPSSTEPNWAFDTDATDSGDLENADWLNAVTEESTSAPISDFAAPAPAAEPELGYSPIGSKDIDALLKLAPVSVPPASESPVPEAMDQLGTVDDNFDIDKVLGAPPEKKADDDDFEIPIITTPGSEASSNGIRRLDTPKTGPNVNLDQLPDWVADMQPTDAPVQLRIGDQEVRVKEVPVSQLDDQLKQLRDRSKSMQQNRAAAGIPSGTGTPGTSMLSGVAGAIDVAGQVMTPAAPTGAATASSASITDIQSKRVKLIQQILELDEQPAQPAALDEAAEEKARKQAASQARRALLRPAIKVDRLIIAVLVAVLVAAPFFTSALNNVLPIPTQPDKVALRDAFTGKINAIPNGQPVIVAFEYGPTAAGELDDLARSILIGLLSHNARPVIVSTNPAGALHAEALLYDLGRDPALGRPLTPSKDYVVLRYLPGGVAGVRAIANALVSNDTLQRQIVFGTDISGQHTDLITPNADPKTDQTFTALRSNPAFVLVESQEDVRNWAEQYNTAQFQENALASQQLTIMLLSTASASATAQTYADTAAAAAGNGSKRIIGPLVGLRDALTFSPANAANISFVRRWESTGLTALLASLIILLGVVINVARGLRRRSRE